MLKQMTIVLAASAGAYALVTERRPEAAASGLVGIYAIVQKVELEPAGSPAERIRIWGAFAFVNGGIGKSLEVSSPQRGQLYFRIPPEGVLKSPAPGVYRKEWADLQAIAGSGQAVAFGSWSYWGTFSADARAPAGLQVYLSGPATPLRSWIRSDSAAALDPILYMTDNGVVKLSESGGHAEIIKQLRAAIAK